MLSCFHMEQFPRTKLKVQLLRRAQLGRLLENECSNDSSPPPGVSQPGVDTHTSVLFYPQGKGVRPWRLSTENPNLFHASRLMREEEERQKQKIMHAAGMYVDEDQAPIAGGSNNRSNSTAGGGGGSAAESGLAGRGQHQSQQHRGEHPSGPPASPPHGRDGDLADTGTGSQVEGDGAVVDGGPNDALDGAASTNSRQVCPDRGRKNERNPDAGEGEDGSYSVTGLDIENDVRKRVLDLVRVVRFTLLDLLSKHSCGWKKKCSAGILLIVSDLLEIFVNWNLRKGGGCGQARLKTRQALARWGAF